MHASSRVRRQAWILLHIALRGLVASRAKSLIVGGIVLFGTALAVVGSSLVDGVDSGMMRSIQGSLAGHIQVYDARSRDALALYGGTMGESDLEPIEDFSRVARTLGAVPNVKAVVPLAIDVATIVMGNALDQALERLRADVRRGADALGASRCPGSPSTTGAYAAHLAHARLMVSLIGDEVSQARRVADEGATDAAERERRRGGGGRGRAAG